MNAESKPRARVTRRFAAPPERVFDAWLDRKLVEKWFAPGMGPMVRVDIDPSIGGEFSFVQRRQGDAGARDVDHRGEYLELLRPRRLVFSWGVPSDSPDKSRVVVEIAPQGSGSELTLTHELHPGWAGYVARTEAAWTKMLDAMAAALF